MTDTKIGDIVVYFLPFKDMPTDPKKLWHGTIREIHRSTTGHIISYDVASIEYPESTGELVQDYQVLYIINQ